MQTEYDDNVLDYWKMPNGNYLAKFWKNDGLNGNNDLKNTLPSQLGAFILSNSKWILKKLSGSCNNSIYYGDTDSLYIHKKLGCVR